MPQKLSFRVLHVSGQDDGHQAVELNHHAPGCKGWQSARFCIYPQDIVLYLESRSRLRKIQILSHQHLIATKIEFFIGDVPEGLPHSLPNARYTRLGYVSLSDNEKTNFRARELKSVHVEAMGVYVKLVVHKNYVNKHNLYNQVGIIAVNVIGDRAQDPLEPLPVPDAVSDYISPLEDLAFDMYQDPEVANVIRQLEKKKQAAVLDERYDFARKLRDAITYLQQVGEKLGRLDIEKRQAIEQENYERAKLKKLQMDEYRLTVYQELDVNSLLENELPPRQPEPFQGDSIDPYQSPPSPQPPASLPLRPIPTSVEERRPQPPQPEIDPDDRPLPALRSKSRSSGPPVAPDEGQREGSPVPPDAEEGEAGGGSDGMSERDIRQAAAAIEVFGLPLVSKAYSKSYSSREEALNEILQRMSQLSPSADKEELKAEFRAAVYIVQRCMKDQVLSVFRLALNLNKLLLVDLPDRLALPRAEILYAVDKVVPPLLQRIGETAARIRDMAKEHVLEMSQWNTVKNVQSIYTECLKPFSPTMIDRLALSRVEVAVELYTVHGLGHHHFTLEALVQFAVSALGHRAGEVREAAASLLVVLYTQEDREIVRQHLPPDEPSTRKNHLYKTLFDKFDRIDGKPTDAQKSKLKADKDAAKQKEIEALQSELHKLRNLAAAANVGGAGPASSRPVGPTKSTPRRPPQQQQQAAPVAPTPQQKATPKPAAANKKQAPAAPPPPEVAAAEESERLLNLDHTCIFCGERNETFTDEGLDMHYWKSCPMLRRCVHCKQVVEIATLTEHLLGECEARANYARCPRCTEAIPVSEHAAHVAEAACKPSLPNQTAIRCPLCHENIPLGPGSTGEEVWKLHLMGTDQGGGCQMNPRRVVALQRQQQQQAGGQRKSQLPKPKPK